MSKLKVRFFGRRRDAGGVAVMVGILLSTGVLLGSAALVVDVGQLYVEREQLQSAADSAAMAVALDCIHARESECTTNAIGNATYYAGLNSADGVSNVDELCGEDPQGWLNPCGLQPDNFSACIGGNPVNTRGWIRVRTTTERSNGTGDERFILPPIFARTVAGSSAGTEVGACSQVAWGTPDTTFAFTVCEKLFNDITNNGTDLAPASPARPNASYEHEFKWTPGATYTGACDDGDDPTRTSFSDGLWTVNADFGWEDRDYGDANCDVDMSHDTDIRQLAPDEPPYTQFECYTTLRNFRISRRPLAVIILRQRDSFWYEVAGVAAFVVTGYRLQYRTPARSTLTRSQCGPRTSVCIKGYFVGALIPNEQLNPSDTSPYGTFGAAEDLGASVVQTVG